MGDKNEEFPALPDHAPALRRVLCPDYKQTRQHRQPRAKIVTAMCRRAGDAADQNYRRRSSSLSVLRWAAMATALIFGFPERDSSNA